MEPDPKNTTTPSRRVPRVQFDTGRDTHTKQSFKDECDINSIMGRYARTGELTHIQQNIARYGDFSNANDYHQALLDIEEAQRQFMELPAAIRARVHHDPGEFLTFVDDPANYEECVKMGIIPDPDNPVADANPPQEKTPQPNTIEGGE